MKQGRRATTGQATAEFAIAFMVLAAVMFGIIDAARLLYEQHGLTRAAEAIAQQLVTLNATNPPPNLEDPTTSWPAVLAGAAQGNISLSTAWPATSAVYCSGGYEQLSSDPTATCTADGTAQNAITVRGYPSLASPASIEVTVRASITPVSSFLIGGRAITLSETVTSETVKGLSD